MLRHDIQINHIVPLHDRITLVIFEDVTLGVTDAKFLRNTHGELMPSRHADPPIGEKINPEIVTAIEAEIDRSEYAENPDDEVITIEVKEPLYSDFIHWCHARSIEPERVLQAFFRFFTEDNADAIRAWINESRCKEMADALAFAKEHVYTQEQVEKDFDSILDVIESGISPVLIRANNGHEALLFGWEDYWSRFSWLEPEGERERVEALCAENETVDSGE